MSTDQSNFNKGGMIAFLFSMVFSIGFFIYVALIHPGVDLKEVPEVAPAPQTAPLAGGGAAPVSKEPWKSSPELVARGQQIFQMNCVMCHGPQGKGDGPAGAGLNPKPRNLVEGKWKKGGRPQDLYSTLTTGIQGSSMAAYGHLPPADRWALVQFIESITQNKVPTDEAELRSFAEKAK